MVVVVLVVVDCGAAVGTALNGSVGVRVIVIDDGGLLPIVVGKRGRWLLLSGRPVVLFEGPFLNMLRLLLACMFWA